MIILSSSAYIDLARRGMKLRLLVEPFCLGREETAKDAILTHGREILLSR